jgi:glycosyltransferase involved in cell wall biosynthesis
MRLVVGLDGKPLAPPRAGVYRYTAGLLAGWQRLAPSDAELVVLQPRGRRRTAPWVLWDLQWATCRRFHVFHFPFYYPPLFPRCPVTVAIHDVLVLTHPQWFPRGRGNTLRWLLPRGARRAAAVVTGTRWVAGQLEEILKLPAQRIRVIPYGLDHQRFAPPDPRAVAEVKNRLRLERPFLLMVGALEPRRGVDTLLQAASLLRQRREELEVVLVGQERAGVPALAAAPPWVRRLGFVEDALLPALYGSAAAVVAPSRGEGFDLPVLEALACGGLVVASDIPVHREVFASAVQLFATGQAEALAAAVQQVLEDTALATKLRQAGLQLARDFSWERAAAQHLALFREVA